MRSAAVVCLFFLSVFLCAAAAAPWLYHAVQWAALSFPQLSSLGGSPFHRYVNRSLIFLSLLSLWPLVRILGLKSWRDLGLSKSRPQMRRTLTGFCWGFGSLACVAIISVALGGRRLDPDALSFAMVRRLFEAALTAGIVAVIEELIFRGALFGGLRTRLGWRRALILSSAIYAIVHFFKKPESPANVTWSSGFTTLAQMIGGFADFKELVPGFLNLALAGSILCLAYQRTTTLYFSIGLHAGWIFWLKFFGFLTEDSGAVAAWFWGSRKLIDGWASSIVLTVVLLSVSRRNSFSSDNLRREALCE